MTFLAAIFGILVALFSTTYSGTQSKAQDSERKTDINALQSHVESYYASYGNYPTLGDINNASWRARNMPGLDSSALQDVDATSETLVASPVKNAYSYQVKADDGGACNNASKDCTMYRLTATLSTGDTYVKESNN